MKTNPVTVDKYLSLEQFVREFLYKYHYEMFPVVENGKPIGCITSGQAKQTTKQGWSASTVEDLLQPCSEKNTLSPDTSANNAISIMKHTGNSQLMVIHEAQLLSYLKLSDCRRGLLINFNVKLLKEGIKRLII